MLQFYDGDEGAVLSFILARVAQRQRVILQRHTQKRKIRKHVSVQIRMVTSLQCKNQPECGGSLQGFDQDFRCVLKTQWAPSYTTQSMMGCGDELIKLYLKARLGCTRWLHTGY